MSRRRRAWRSLMMVSGLAVLGAVAIALGLRPPSLAADRERSASSSLIASYLYRFDPIAQTFVTIPLAAGSQPIAVVVTGTHD